MSPSQTSWAASGARWEAATEAAQPKTAQNGPERMASKEMFLQLLVAQIRHQNPLNPANGTEFVAQLAQFTQLEATLDIRKDLDEIREALKGTVQPGAETP
ncbi:MAG: flagellar hook assembly protein FlgD [Acidobacteriota bacterium]